MSICCAYGNMMRPSSTISDCFYSDLNHLYARSVKQLWNSDIILKVSHTFLQRSSLLNEESSLLLIGKKYHALRALVRGYIKISFSFILRAMRKFSFCMHLWALNNFTFLFLTYSAKPHIFHRALIQLFRLNHSISYTTYPLNLMNVSLYSRLYTPNSELY